MGRWLGGIYGNTVLANTTQANTKGVFSQSDQYYMVREGGWREPIPGEDQSNPASHADAIVGAGGGSGTYWITIAGAARQLEVIANGVGGKNWIKLHAENSGGFWETAFNSWPSQCDGSNNHNGWVTYSGKRYFRSYPGTHDTEMWNNFSIANYQIRYVYGEVYWAPMNHSWQVGNGHPDNDQYSNYKDNDNDYNSRNYGGTGGNRSWHRWGVADQVQMAYDELGFTGERSNERGPIYCGDKSGNYPGNNSRSGSGATGYWDLGEASTRTFRFSTGNESGAPTTECYSWSPHRIYVA